jgi:hypothetical protein
VLADQQLEDARVVKSFASSSLRTSASTVWSMDGMSTLRAYSLYSGMLAIMFENESMPLSASWCARRVFHRQQAAPRLAEQVEVAGVEAERLAHLLDLVDEAGDIEERRVVGLVAVRTSRADRSSSTRCPRRGRRSCRTASKYSWVKPGPPWSSRHLDARVVAHPLGSDGERALRRAHRDALDARR